METQSNPLPSMLRIAERHSLAFYFSISIALLGVVVSADAFTPFELGFSAFYVLPVLIASWGLGRSKGLGFALLAACCWYLADVSSGRPLSYEFYRLWDTFNHLVAFTLVAVVTGSLKQALNREQELRENLEKTLQNVHELEGLLPVCAWCKKIRDDEGYWQELEAYLQPRTKASFTHGICPNCAKSLRTDTEQHL